MHPLRVLVACEFSGVVRDAFIAQGHDAISCDLLPTERIGAHIQGDVLEHLDDGWDLMIAHPPCTYLSNMSNCQSMPHCEILQQARQRKRELAMQFFLALAAAPIDKICIENPRGYPERVWRKSDQIIQPYQFGHYASKATCLWLKNLPLLTGTKLVAPERRWSEKRKRWDTWTNFHSNWGNKASHTRSITFQGIADAMANQWGGV